VAVVDQVAQPVAPLQQVRGGRQVDRVGELALAQVEVADLAVAPAGTGELERLALLVAEAALVADRHPTGRVQVQV
jgi:hypothetical protein